MTAATQARCSAWLAVLASNRLRFDRVARLAGQAMSPPARAAGDDRRAGRRRSTRSRTCYAYLGEPGPLAGCSTSCCRCCAASAISVPAAVGGLRVVRFAARRGADWARPPSTGWARRIALSRSAAATRLHESWFVAHLGWVARLQGRLRRARCGHGRRAVDLAGRRAPLVRADRPARVAGRHPARAAADRGGRELLDRRPRTDQGRRGGGATCCAASRPLAEVTGRPGGAGRGGRAARRHRPRRPARPGSWAPTPTWRSPAAWLRRTVTPARARAVLAPLLAAAARLGWVPVLAAAGRWSTAAPPPPLGDPAAALRRWPGRRSCADGTACPGRRGGTPRQSSPT